MTNSLQDFDEKFKVQQLLIAETDHWRWSVRPTHSTLGSGVLSLRRFCVSMAEATTEEISDLAVIIKLIEERLQATFKPEKMNYLMLMMVDKHLHFHVLPRYASPRKFAGQRWIDGGWPGIPEMGANSDLADSEILFSVKNALK